MPNLRVVYKNEANSVAAITASTTAGSLAASNLLNDRKNEVWRATGTTADLTLTWGSSVTLSMVGLAFSNLSASATIRVRAYTLSGDASPAYDSGNLPCGVADTGVTSPVGFGGGKYAAVWFPSRSAQKILVTITDSSNPSGYIEAGRIITGAYWSPARDAESDSVRLTMADDSKHSRSESGALWTDRGPMYKKLQFDLSYMTASDRDYIWRIVAGNGMYNSVFISMMPSSGNTFEEQIHMIYGRLSNASALQYKYSHLHATQLQLEEV